MVSLTKRQKEVLDFVKDYVRANAIAPSLQEIGAAMGFGANAAWRHVNALEEVKLVTWRKSKNGGKRQSARNIKVRGKCPYCGGVVR